MWRGIDLFGVLPPTSERQRKARKLLPRGLPWSGSAALAYHEVALGKTGENYGESVTQMASLRNSLHARLGLLALCGCLLATALCPAAQAQEPPPLLAPPTSASEDQLTVEAIQARLDQIEQDSQLDEAAKAELKKTYEQALERMRAALDWTTKAAQYETLIREAPVATRQAKADLEIEPSEPELELPPDATVQQLEELLAQKQADLAEQEQKLLALESEIKRRVSRAAEAAKTLESLREKKAELEAELAAASSPDLSPEMAQAQRTLLQARLAAVAKQIQAEEREPAAFSATSELITLRRDLLAARVPRRKEEIEQLTTLLERLSRREKQRQASIAQSEAAEAPRRVKPLVDKNLELARQRTALDQATDAAAASLAEEQAKLAELQKRFKRVQQKIDAVGLTDAVGAVLRRERAQLPEIDHFDSREDAIRETHLKLLELQDLRADLANPEEEVERIVAQIAASPAGRGVTRETLREEVGDVLRTRRQYLDKLIPDYEQYFNTLVELDEVERQLAQEVEQYSLYIDERILWIRSSPPYGWRDLLGALATLQELVDPQNWTRAGLSLWSDLREHALQSILVLFAVVLLFYYQRRLRHSLREIGQKVQRTAVAPVGKTMEAAGITVLIALLWPGLLALVGWRLEDVGGPADFASAVGAGLIGAAAVFFPLELLRQSCRSLGLAEAHFQWPKQATQQVRRRLRPLMLVVVPMALIVGIAERTTGPGRDDPLGRLAFMLAMGAIALFAHRLLSRRSGVVRTLLARDPDSWLARLRPLWHALCGGLPLVLAVIALGGYYYTALQLAWRLNMTFCYVLALVFLNGAILRWVMIARIRLARLQAQERLAELQGEGKEAAPSLPEMSGAPLELPESDVRKLGVQTRQLLRTVLALVTVVIVWMIWVDVLPALGVFDRIELWSISVTSNEIVEGADASQQTQTVTRLEAITLADLALVGIVLILTFVAMRNLPGMLEMTLLQRLPFDAGGRYAITTISRYLIVLVGLIFATALVGLSWSNVQWLAAAITVGLGFGLQEIFANFISGLILLFERPIRVGDIVTIDSVTGVVSKIQMRATTITNWDRQDYVVPNKEFITGRLLNWTLSNPVNRLTINVGIAYGSDTEKAHQLLHEILTAHPEVMEDPAPFVTFEGFGDSALNFVIRCYLPTLDKRLQTIHELHTSIDQAFRQAGIEIAFPQRDLHIRSIKDVVPLTRAANGNGTPDGNRSPERP